MTSAGLRTVAVVQARTSSTRFPGKVLAPIAGVPMILHVCRRIAACARVDELVVATSTDPSDDGLAAAVAAAGYSVHRGSLDDVLSRFAAAARERQADVVVRVTGDCPVVDPEVLCEMLGHFADHDCRYLSNIAPRTYPNGLDLEVMTMEALAAADQEAATDHEREHVTPFIRDRPDRYPACNHVYGRDVSDLHWSVDEPYDLAVVEDLLAATGGAEMPLLDELVAQVDRDPDLRRRSTLRPLNRSAIATLAASLAEADPLPRFYGSGAPAPPVAQASGSRVWDAHGDEYVDYGMRAGVVTLGHRHPEVEAAAQAAGAASPDRTAGLAARTAAALPGEQIVRFGPSAEWAEAACLAMARAATGRHAIARHEAAPSPQQSVPGAFGDLAELEELLGAGTWAAVVVEPVALGETAGRSVGQARELARGAGAMLVLDECRSGLRYGPGGAQARLGVDADLAWYGAVLANGHQIGAVAGAPAVLGAWRREAAPAAAVAAALATLDVMERDDYWSEVSRRGSRLQHAYRRAAAEFRLEHVTDCIGLPPATCVTFSGDDRWSGAHLAALFHQELLRHRVLATGPQFVSPAHSEEDLTRTIAAYHRALRVVRFALDNHGVDALTVTAPR